MSVIPIIYRVLSEFSKKKFYYLTNLQFSKYNTDLI